MLIVSYDISSDKVRGRFAKFLESYGTRLQYSIFEITNSERVLNIITEEIKHNFEKHFTGADSVIIFKFSEREGLRFGNAKHRVESLLVF